VDHAVSLLLKACAICWKRLFGALNGRAKAARAILEKEKS